MTPTERAARWRRNNLARSRAWFAARQRRRTAFVATFKTGPCTDCGYRYPPECMDFDHVRGRKKAPVNQLTCCSLAVLKREMRKCELVCANCHRIRTRIRLASQRKQRRARAVH